MTFADTSQTANPPGPAWTMADFLSTYRFWSLFIAAGFTAFVSQLVVTMLPHLMYKIGYASTPVTLVFSAIPLGTLFGSFIIFMIAPRLPRLALCGPLFLFAIIAAIAVFFPDLLINPFFLFAGGFFCALAQTATAFSPLVFLVGGRPSRQDFGNTAVLLTVGTVMSFIAPIAGVNLLEADQNGRALFIVILISTSIAALTPMISRGLDFSTINPRPRHAPLTPKRRSPWLVFIVTALPLILSLVVLIFRTLGWISFLGGHSNDAFMNLAVLVAYALLVIWVVYVAYWFYRIHGELAGAAPSQKLLTPLPAMLVGMLVPFGFPMLLMVLGDLLNARARDAGKPRTVPIWAVGIFSIVFSPIAMALIQHGANKNYKD